MHVHFVLENCSITITNALQVTLLDSLRKRCDFVQSSIGSLGIGNAATLWGRAETLAQDGAHRERYHVATARAVAEMNVLAEYCLPFVRLGGLFLAAKGPAPHAEVEAGRAALGELGGQLLGIEPVQSFSRVHGDNRTTVLVRKVRQTPAQYPRREGKPGKRPL
jgi:16S rRNA G527 N7-methylase RsmG